MATTRTRKKDPFAEPATNETETETTMTKEAPLEQNETQGDQNYTTVILKGGKGYGAPSVSLRGANVRDVRRHMEEQRDDLEEVIRLSAKYGVAFAELVDGPASAGSNSGGGSNTRSGGGAGRTEAPGGQSRQCKHGDMVFRSGSKNGRTWEAFFCPTPQGTADQCKPQFL